MAMIGLKGEPSLEELLNDGAARLLMAADGIHEGTVRELIETVIEARRELRD